MDRRLPDLPAETTDGLVPDEQAHLLGAIRQASPVATLSVGEIDDRADAIFVAGRARERASGAAGVASKPRSSHGSLMRRRMLLTAVGAVVGITIAAVLNPSRFLFPPSQAVADRSSMQDTLSMVRFLLVAPGAATVRLVGDFGQSKVQSTPLRADTGGTWWAALALTPGTYRYGFVVDDTGWAVDPKGSRSIEWNGRHWSVMVVPRSAN